MSRWLEYASLFEEGIENPYFEARSAYQALSSVKNTLKEKSGKMIFLLGQPGSGKTYLLNHLLQDETLEHRPVLFDTPISNPKSFLTRLIKHMNEDIASEEIDILKEQAENLYADKKILIMLDEAQLLNDETLEFIRILSDSRKFWIVCAMHEEEGREILGKSHFKSRPHKLIELGQLSPKELNMFVNTQLVLFQDKYVSDFHQKHAKKIYSLSKGNFRYLKKLIYTEFSLLHEAQELGMKKFEEPSKCLLNMAAIEIGLINV